MRINHNISALVAWRHSGLTERAFTKSLERLSSGLRINRAADDAAGLAISEKMRAQINGLNQAVRNAQDAVSLIQTAEGALNESHEILQRLRVLAVQASNDTLTTQDREALQGEVDEFVDELQRIADTTEFNTKKLLNGETSGVVAKDGANGTAAANIAGAELTGDPNYSGTLKVNVTQAGRNAIYTAEGSKNHDNVAVGWNFVDGNWTLGGAFIGATFDGDESITVTQDGISVTVGVSGGMTFNELVADLNQAFEEAGMHLEAEIESFGRGLVFTATKVGTDYNVSVTANNWGGAATFELSTANGQEAQDAEVVLEDAKTGRTSETYIVTGDTLDITSSDANLRLENLTLVLSQAALQSVSDDIARLKIDPGIAVQIGANEGQKLAFRIGNMTPGELGRESEVSSTFASIEDLKSGEGLVDRDNAEKAITLIDAAIADVSEERSKLGALQNRLEHAINNLSVTAENLTAAEARIRDADMAGEMMALTKIQILRQAGTAMMAQANLKPQSILQLLA